MANAILYYRTAATLLTTIALLPAAQKLTFTPPNDLASGIEEEWTNNIVRKVPPKPSGRKLIQTDEGFSGWILTISGNYLVGEGNSSTRLFNFRKLPQGITDLPLGVFGIVYPNGPSYLTINPTSVGGLMIQSTRGKHIGLTTQLFDFSVSLSFGGTA